MCYARVSFYFSPVLKLPSGFIMTEFVSYTRTNMSKNSKALNLKDKINGNEVDLSLSNLTEVPVRELVSSFTVCRTYGPKAQKTFKSTLIMLRVVTRHHVKYPQMSKHSSCVNWCTKVRFKVFKRTLRGCFPRKFSGSSVSNCNLT